MTKVINTVSEILDDVFWNGRIAREKTDARVTEILGQVGDGTIDANSAWVEIFYELQVTYGADSWEDCREAAAEILNAVGVPYDLDGEW